MSSPKQARVGKIDASKQQAVGADKDHAQQTQGQGHGRDQPNGPQSVSHTENKSFDPSRPTKSQQNSGHMPAGRSSSLPQGGRGDFKPGSPRGH